jgi:hypothetical protein
VKPPFFSTLQLPHDFVEVLSFCWSLEATNNTSRRTKRKNLRGQNKTQKRKTKCRETGYKEKTYQVGLQEAPHL